MSRAVFLAAALAVFVCPSATDAIAGQNQPEILTNASVIELHELGFSDELIIQKIMTSQPDFDVSLAGLKQLKSAGVPDSVISVMIDAVDGASNNSAYRIETSIQQHLRPVALPECADAPFMQLKDYPTILSAITERFRALMAPHVSQIFEQSGQVRNTLAKIAVLRSCSGAAEHLIVPARIRISESVTGHPMFGVTPSRELVPTMTWENAITGHKYEVRAHEGQIHFKQVATQSIGPATDSYTASAPTITFTNRSQQLVILNKVDLHHKSLVNAEALLQNPYDGHAILHVILQGKSKSLSYQSSKNEWSGQGGDGCIALYATQAPRPDGTPGQAPIGQGYGSLGGLSVLCIEDFLSRPRVTHIEFVDPLNGQVNVASRDAFLVDPDEDLLLAEQTVLPAIVDASVEEERRALHEGSADSRIPDSELERENLAAARMLLECVDHFVYADHEKFIMRDVMVRDAENDASRHIPELADLSEPRQASEFETRWISLRSANGGCRAGPGWLGGGCDYEMEFAWNDRVVGTGRVVTWGIGRPALDFSFSGDCRDKVMTAVNRLAGPEFNGGPDWLAGDDLVHGNYHADIPSVCPYTPAGHLASWAVSAVSGELGRRFGSQAGASVGGQFGITGALIGSIVGGVAGEEGARKFTNDMLEASHLPAFSGTRQIFQHLEAVHISDSNVDRAVHALVQVHALDQAFVRSVSDTLYRKAF